MIRAGDPLYLDVTPYFWRTEDRGGIYHYIRNFLLELAKDPPAGLWLFVRGRGVIEARKVSCWARHFPVKWVRLPGQLHRIIPLLRGSGKYLTLWEDLPALWGLKVYSVVHDLRALIYEEELLPCEKDLPFWRQWKDLPEARARRRYFSTRKRMLERVLSKARGLVAISRFTAQGLVSRGIEEERVKVVYHGPLPPTSPAPLPTELQNNPYVLYVGKFEPLKNVERLLLAFKLWRKTNPRVRLVCAGPLTWYGRFLVKRFSSLEGVYFLDFVSPNLLESLYRKALFLVLPSLYEGFGLPVLEAMSRGVAVAASDIAPLREVAGLGAYFFDPFSPKALRDAFSLLWEDRALREKLASCGLERSRKFSWEKTVLETISFVSLPYAENP